MNLKKTFWLYIAMILLNVSSFYANVWGLCLHTATTWTLFLIWMNILAIFTLVFTYQKLWYLDEIRNVHIEQLRLNAMINTSRETRTFDCANNKSKDTTASKESEIPRPETSNALQYMELAEGDSK